MVFNTLDSGKRRWDMAPVCKWDGKGESLDLYRSSKQEVKQWRGKENTITVKPEEWDYFLAYIESRKIGHSCPCNKNTQRPGPECNELKAPGQHWHSPKTNTVTFDCKLWTAAFRHAEDQCIQGFFSHISRDGFSPRMRCLVAGCEERGEHQAGRHTTGPGALAGLQTSAGHCNSMFDERYAGFAAGHGMRRNDERGDGDVWTVLYNFGDDHITDSESCIPEGWTATGERTDATLTPSDMPSLAPTDSGTNVPTRDEDKSLIPDGVELLRNTKLCTFEDRHPRFNCPIKKTKNANKEIFFKEMITLFGKNNCEINIQGKVVWAWQGKTFYFLTSEPQSLDDINNCFAAGTQIVDSIGPEATNNPTVDPITSPSSNPSADLTMSPSTTQRGNVHVNYYEALAWNSLPSSGLSSLSPYKAEMVDNINYPSTEGTFAGSGRTIHVAALFEAYLEFPFPDRYYMCITSDDGSKLFLDNMLVIDNDETHSSTEVCSFYNGTGVTKMEVEYFQRGGGKELFVKWVPMSRPPNFRLMVVIPPSAFVQKPKMTETPSSRPSNFPSILPSKVLHICNDSTTWIQGG
eukprot:CAMPEP_0113318120 /NCGR_PEP_ID=MMETSP0010_2-20120614/12797_1 /TAXON_ID=216773 ORGANISM="Corethron hystrix, Strain 308" /NCGR_SAMPLE_ID=MMETSP0010_2 /ASSEMBLY_ACC=CAM_ASM_000155 /LENGTH=576 /DNA_ID=CAMNT_0000175321 /DNA_START=361 /DNA_END=2088 /DNA_ORIENTATION=- /assembly_acc=CAM_ASM_000155